MCSLTAVRRSQRGADQSTRSRGLRRRLHLVLDQQLPVGIDVLVSGRRETAVVCPQVSGRRQRSGVSCGQRGRTAQGVKRGQRPSLGGDHRNGRRLRSVHDAHDHQM